MAKTKVVGVRLSIEEHAQVLKRYGTVVNAMRSTLLTPLKTDVNTPVEVLEPPTTVNTPVNRASIRKEIALSIGALVGLCAFTGLLYLFLKKISPKNDVEKTASGCTSLDPSPRTPELD